MFLHYLAKKLCHRSATSSRRHTNPLWTSSLTIVGCVLTLAATAIATTHRPVAEEELPQSRAERSNYEQTSRHAEVFEFFQELQKLSPLVRLETFGQTVEGRDLPLVVLADPPIFQPREARTSGKPVVFIMANIHAGEVEGKEAMQHLARRIALGDLRPLLDKIIILIAPNYNADGNERIDPQHRTEQYGPIQGVGIRENAKGYDLNRDYMKLDTPEARGLVGLLNDWDPHLTVDLHTTNGSYHGYHLTYSIPLNPTVDSRLIAYHREQMMPALHKAMADHHQYRTYYYGNYGPAEVNGKPTGERSWKAFSHLPRIGQNYVGLRNRLTILSESYSYLDFKERVKSTAAFVEEIFKYAAAHGDEIQKLTRQIDDDTIRQGLSEKPLDIGVDYEMSPLPEPVEILSGEVVEVPNPHSGKPMTAMVVDKATPEKMLDFGAFTATRSVPAAHTYLFAREAGLKVALEKLLGHGIAVEQLCQPLTAEVDVFIVEQLTPSPFPFEGHRESQLSGKFEQKTVEFPAGTFLVRTSQPLGRLAAYLLEPESDDGLVNWNFLDSYLTPGTTYPIYKLMKPAPCASRMLEETDSDPQTSPAEPKLDPKTAGGTKE